MRALLIANADDADPAYVGQRFRHHGFAFTECHRERPDEWPDLDGHDLVLMLGSEWSVYWPQVASNVAAEAALVRAAQQRGVPQFGICFGSQIMAHALGGTVERARTPEIGWYDVVTDVPEAIASGPWFEWHSDVVTVPPGAHELARTTVGPQAWRLGRSFCTQFHPEVNESVIVRWTSGSGAAEVEAFGQSIEELVEQTRRNVQVSREHTDALVDWFVAAVAG
jgi:GMP synthase-like glutamine amidotransferase